MPGLQQLVPSYLSIDTDSRVVRLDSWSKVLAPGLRLGWVTGHPDVVDLMALALHASLNGPPGISQVCTTHHTQLPDTLLAQLKGTQSKDTNAVECCYVHKQDVAIVSC